MTSLLVGIEFSRIGMLGTGAREHSGHGGQGLGESPANGESCSPVDLG
ncbi:hypothetical protein [Bifidobacterium tibiigranuli]|nr:hypothetical protein [Bifidobacterium tibiigranuli]MCH3973455.1 hypothetical protein [Bifidobacterium tibiigranuli]